MSVSIFYLLHPVEFVFKKQRKKKTPHAKMTLTPLQFSYIPSPGENAPEEGVVKPRHVGLNSVYSGLYVYVFLLVLFLKKNS